jgi:hypothetical protein
MSKRFAALAVLGAVSVMAGCGPSEPPTAGAFRSARSVSAPRNTGR